MTAPLTNDDKGFIRSILDDPDELTTWLIYADWLDEQNDPRAEFLRLSVTLKQLAASKRARRRIEKRLTELRMTLDPNWVLVFDTSRLANCRGSGWRFICPLTWDQLSPTDEPDIRICHTCKSPVFFCHSVEEANQFATSGQCVAISSRVPLETLPREEPEVMMVGIMAPPVDEDFLYELEDETATDPPTTTPAPPPRRRPWWKFW
jgi:uncharacterized protein (TIGR02996 family)